MPKSAGTLCGQVRRAMFSKPLSLVTTLALVFTWGYVGAAIAEAASYEYVTEWGNGVLWDPSCVVVDSQDNVYVVDQGHSRVVKYSTEGSPRGVVGAGIIGRCWACNVDLADNLYVADPMNARVVKFRPDGSLAGFIGVGHLLRPVGVAVDAAGNVYVSDEWAAPDADSIIKFAPDGTRLNSWGKGGTAPGQTRMPYVLQVDNARGYLYLCDDWNYRIQRFTLDGDLIDIPVCNVHGPRFNLDRYGILYVTDNTNHQVLKISPNGKLLAAWGSYGIGPGQFTSIYSVAVDSKGAVYVSDEGPPGEVNDRVQKFVSVNAPAEVHPGGDATLDEGAAFFRIAGFSDPDSTDWTVMVDYGDGTPAEEVPYASDHSFMLNHVYPDNEIYELTVAVTDDGGLTGSASMMVTVVNVAPTARIAAIVPPVPDFILPGDLIRFEGDFDDPGTADTHTFRWAFGDGGGSTSQNALYAYQSPGQYTVTFTVTDDDGGVGTAIATVTVLNPSRGLGELTDLVWDFLNDKPGTACSLVTKLEQAIKKLEQGNEKAAINQVEAFINEVEAQRGKKLTNEEADLLIERAEQLRALLLGLSFREDFATDWSCLEQGLYRGRWRKGDEINNDLNAHFEPRNVYVSDETLKLTVRGFLEQPPLGPFSSAGVFTECKEYHLGVYEACIKAAGQPGVCNAFFVYRWDPDQPYNRHEIDVELLSKDFVNHPDGTGSGKVRFTIHPNPGDTENWWDKLSVWPNRYTREVELPFDPSTGYFIYGFEWSKNGVRFFVRDKDGKRIPEVKDVYLSVISLPSDPSHRPIPSLPGAIMLNCWCGGGDDWDDGPPLKTTTMEVGWVQFTQEK